MPAASSLPSHSRSRASNHLVRAWLFLLILSVVSAALTLLPIPATLLGAGILTLATLKCRVILARYLDLSTSPAWLRGFTMVFVAFALVIFGLYLV